MKKRIRKKPMKNKVLLLSIDGLSIVDWEYLKSLPTFKYIMENGSYSNQLISVYPTQTYTVHTTMVTGNYPNKHGVYNNKPFQPFVSVKDQKWFWFEKEIKTQTIYTCAKKNKLKTCGILWPVSGRSSINYCFPELAAIKNENLSYKIIRNGSFWYMIYLELKFRKQRISTDQPHLDQHIKRCTIDTIKRKKPDYMMVHLVSLDAAKHKYSAEGEIINETIKKLDETIGEIIKAANEENYTILLLGDHSHITIKKSININKLLEDAKLIDYKNKSYRAYIQSMGGSAILHIKEGDNEARDIALKILEDNKDECGIESIYKKDDLKQLHFFDKFEYVIEGKAGYAYTEDQNNVLVDDFVEQHKLYATHGYNPNKKNYSCVFMAMGNEILENNKLGKMNMVDIAPTIANILGIEFSDCDGKIIDSIFK